MEETLRFSCRDKMLFGILHNPDRNYSAEKIILMVIGGPQTRVGSHRLYVQLARFLAEHGVPSMRFDYEGMGDSEGEFIGFENAAASIEAAIDFLFSRFPLLKDVIIWSLCDGASACALYAPFDQDRIRGMVLANPYVETETGQAKTFLKHYYFHRLFEKEFWQKLASRKFSFTRSINGLLSLAKKTLAGKKESGAAETLPFRVLDGVLTFHNPVHLLISENDMTGLEFYDLVQNQPKSRKKLNAGGILVHQISGADHTFTRSQWKKDMFEKTLHALDSLGMKSKKQVAPPAKSIAAV